MMWVENKNKLRLVFDSYQYAEITDFIDNNKIDMSKAHRTYSIMPSDIFNNANTTNRVLISSNAKIICNYVADTVKDFDILYEEFISLISTILTNNKIFSIVAQPIINKPISKNNRIFTITTTIHLGSTTIC